MLEQLDLFTIAMEKQEQSENTSLPPEERKLVPPQVILQQSAEQPDPVQDIPVTQKRIQTLFDETEIQQALFSNEPEKTEDATILQEEVAALSHTAQTGIFLEIKPESHEKPKSGRGRKASRDPQADADKPTVPEDHTLFSKPFYGIGEVAAMFRITTSQLRYWESEFDILAPRKNAKGETFFRPEDIKTLLEIHDLLRNKKMTIESARARLRKSDSSHQKQEVIRQLEQLKRFLQEMKADLLIS
jgi:DNA-binding transcriptional MerR regulator